ncbi:MAG TPA: Na-translocating system protein MpsC family protein [Solirubrobacterales bacterium]
MDRPDLPDSPARGALVSQLSREIVQLHARLYGRGPTKARSYLHGDYAVCILEEVFTTAERTLIVAGSGDHVSDTRKKFQDAVGKEFIDVVERITERTVRVFLSQVDVEANLALEFFIFAEPNGGDKKTRASNKPDGA